MPRRLGRPQRAHTAKFLRRSECQLFKTMAFVVFALPDPKLSVIETYAQNEVVSRVWDGGSCSDLVCMAWVSCGL